MKKLLFILSSILLCTTTNGQQTGTLLYNWQDNTLVASTAHNNTYNECWGVVVNDREIDRN